MAALTTQLWRSYQLTLTSLRTYVSVNVFTQVVGEHTVTAEEPV